MSGKTTEKTLRRVHRIILLLLVLALVWVTLYRSGKFAEKKDNTIASQAQAENAEEEEVLALNYTASTVLDDTTGIDKAILILLQQTDSDFRGNLPLDESFFYWLAETYGKGTVCDLAYAVYENGQNNSLWESYTGATVHTLYTQFCQDKSYATYATANVHSSEGDGSISVVGDVNLADNWYTMQSLNGNDLSAAVSADLLDTLNASSVTFVNNEFVFSQGGTPLEGKPYTFESDPSNIYMLSQLGTDLVSLANNHVYDYGEAGLLSTLSTLADNDITYVGAGENLAEAMTPQYYIVNGKKIAFVAATQVEINLNYTRQATETTAGVLKTLDPTYFTEEIKEAKRNSDYVVVYVHWGWEGRLTPDEDQMALAQAYVDAGADVIIGNHSHRLQGATYIDNVPVIYSLGNFWMSTGDLYTSVVQISFDDEGNLLTRMLPCQQNQLTVSYAQDETRFYEYVADLSTDVNFTEDGFMYQPLTNDRCIYYSGMNYATHSPDYDLDGENIDNVGNLK